MDWPSCPARTRARPGREPRDLAPARPPIACSRAAPPRCPRRADRRASAQRADGRSGPSRFSLLGLLLPAPLACVSSATSRFSLRRRSFYNGARPNPSVPNPTLEDTARPDSLVSRSDPRSAPEEAAGGPEPPPRFGGRAAPPRHHARALGPPARLLEKLGGARRAHPSETPHEPLGTGAEL